MRISVFKKTNDNWHPSYKLDNNVNLVEVIFTQTGPNPPYIGTWRVCVWGGDDYGMEKDFLIESDAKLMFLTVISWENVDVESLQAIGFTSA